jgi:hypothetical protein
VRANFPTKLEYVVGTILEMVKEKIARAWTDCVIHIENKTTDMIEYVHNRIKKFLANNIGDVCKIWVSINSMIKLEHTEMRASFYKNTILMEHRFKGNVLWSKLVENIFRNGSQLIADEAD